MLNMQNVKDIEIQEGDVRTIHDKDNRLIWGRLAYDTKYAGDTVQDGTPTPDAPIPVQVVTGEQTVTIGDGVDSEDFTISLGTTELCKIGDYQDYIYNSGDDWYIHKECGKVVFNGSENWNYNNMNQVFGVSLDATFPLRTTTNPYCDNYIGQTTVTFNMVLNKHISLQSTTSADSQRVLVKDLDIEQSFEAFKTWLSTHNTTLYYPLATPTDTKITDATLIGQLNAVHEWLTRYGYNATVSGNLPIIINKTNL